MSIFTGQQIKDSILRAKSILDGKDLCKGWWARNKDGLCRLPCMEDAVSVCTFGCFMDATQDRSLIDAATNYVTNFLIDKDKSVHGLASWNDEVLRTKEDVLTLFTEAAASINVDAAYDEAGEEVSLDR